MLPGATTAAPAVSAPSPLLATPPPAAALPKIPSVLMSAPVVVPAQQGLGPMAGVEIAPVTVPLVLIHGPTTGRQDFVIRRFGEVRPRRPPPGFGIDAPDMLAVLRTAATVTNRHAMASTPWTTLAWNTSISNETMLVLLGHWFSLVQIVYSQLTRLLPPRAAGRRQLYLDIATYWQVYLWPTCMHVAEAGAAMMIEYVRAMSGTVDEPRADALEREFFQPGPLLVQASDMAERQRAEAEAALLTRALERERAQLSAVGDELSAARNERDQFQLAANSERLRADGLLLQVERCNTELQRTHKQLADLLSAPPPAALPDDVRLLLQVLESGRDAAVRRADSAEQEVQALRAAAQRTQQEAQAAGEARDREIQRLRAADATQSAAAAQAQVTAARELAAAQADAQTAAAALAACESRLTEAGVQIGDIQALTQRAAAAEQRARDSDDLYAHERAEREQREADLADVRQQFDAAQAQLALRQGAEGEAARRMADELAACRMRVAQLEEALQQIQLAAAQQQAAALHQAEAEALRRQLEAATLAEQQASVEQETLTRAQLVAQYEALLANMRAEYDTLARLHAAANADLKAMERDWLQMTERIYSAVGELNVPDTSGVDALLMRTIERLYEMTGEGNWYEEDVRSARQAAADAARRQREAQEERQTPGIHKRQK